MMCVSFEEKDSVDARSQMSKTRESLERYLFYFERCVAAVLHRLSDEYCSYKNHDQSKKLEKKLVAAVRAKMDEWQATVLACTWQDVKVCGLGSFSAG